ncbi:RHS repeat-associated core domain-containing protein [Corallococcus sp. AB049A]|uniref:RHS repeat-associated core domain-containing protein n=1 Tax=Corallococcus sp. AB049A TaxID=2316721 RepID=UPI001F2BA90E|nr:RHS repeat-associated core domain-containing protein [Corallococcus sp. AB049A]
MRAGSPHGSFGSSLSSLKAEPLHIEAQSGLPVRLNHYVEMDFNDFSGNTMSQRGPYVMGLLLAGLLLMPDTVLAYGAFSFCAPPPSGGNTLVQWTCTCPDANGNTGALYCNGNDPNGECHLQTCLYPPNGSQTDIGNYTCCPTGITCGSNYAAFKVLNESCYGPDWECDLGTECTAPDDVCKTGYCEAKVDGVLPSGEPINNQAQCKYSDYSACDDEDEDDVCSGVGGPGLVGDPVIVASRGTRHPVTDVELKGTVGGLSLERVYVSSVRKWAHQKSLGELGGPYLARPFGAAAESRESLHWWHNFYSFVHSVGSGGGETWKLREGSGSLLEFTGCTRSATSCLAQPASGSNETPARLVWESTGTGTGYFVLHKPGEGRFFFEALWIPTGSASFSDTRYFLTRIEDAQHPAPGGLPRTRATLSYATPPGLTCPGGGAGATAGVPFLHEVSSSEGTRLRFIYKKLPSARAEIGEECVLASVSLMGDAGVLMPLVEYTYAPTGSVSEVGGRIAQAKWPQRGGMIEKYEYQDNTGAPTWKVSRGGTAQTQHTYQNGYVTYDSESLSGWFDINVQMATRATGACDSSSSPECLERISSTVVKYGYQGNGGGYAGYEGRNYVQERTGFARAPRVKSIGVGCSGTSCTRMQEYVWSTLSNGVVVNRAKKDWNGAWTTRDWVVPTGASTSTLPELRTLAVGATAADGTGALKTTHYTYEESTAGAGVVLGERLRVEEKKVSLLQTGADAVQRNVYDPLTNRLQAVIRSGYTEGLGSGGAAPVPVLKHQATFYFTRQVCSGGTTDDALGRVLEVHGPCWVSGPTATDCSATLNATIPVIQYEYWSAGTGNSNANRLKKVSRYPQVTSATGCSGQTALETQYANYDVRGNPRSVTDPNGIETTYAYEEDRVTSITTQGATWEYLYDNGMMTAVHFPRGDYERFCYRGSGFGHCTSGWMGKLTLRAKQAFLNSYTWSEEVQYDYGADQRPKRETFHSNFGSDIERRQRSLQVDMNGNPTYELVGGRGGGYPPWYIRPKLFDGASRLIGVGLAYNSPPALCGGLDVDGRPVSPLCNAMSYDRADRLTGVDEYPEIGTRTGGTRTCMSYDAHGNMATVRTGCPATGSGGDCSACAQPESTYRYDDFGRVIAVKLPWQGGDGWTRYDYDAAGNLLAKQTPQMRADGEHLAYAYDAMGRRLSATRVVGGSAPLIETLYTLGYDNSATPDSSCPQPVNTKGRMLFRNDSFGQTWLSYDAWGRVTKEIRVRRSAGNTFTCPSDTPASTLHTSYAYSTSGDLLSVTYPYGHRVTYGYRFYPNTTVPSDRVGTVTVERWSGSAWTALASVSDILWEPYAGLRSYKVNSPGAANPLYVEYALGNNRDAPPVSPCSEAAPPYPDFTGRQRNVWVSSAGFSWSGGTGNLYRRVYTWKGDEIIQEDTCLLGGPTPTTVKYEYDGLGRLKNVTRPAGNVAAVGGTVGSRSYGYDGRGNRISQVEDGTALTLTHGTGALVDRLERRQGSAAGSMLDYQYSYDLDGRTIGKRWVEVAGTPVYQLQFNHGASVGGASETVFRSVDVNGSTYEYFYDAMNRRRLKRYPTTVEDEFFYDLDHSLLVDRGNSSVSPPVGGFTHYVDDTYVWLDDRPIMVVRGQLTSERARVVNPVGDCSRNGEAAACGVYFPVTDALRKAIVIFDAAAKVAGAADYEPFGKVNRVSLYQDSLHPLPGLDGGTPQELLLAEMNQPVPEDGGVVIRERALFHLLGTANVAHVELRNQTDGATLAPSLSATAEGHVWTPWITPTQGKSSAVLVTTGMSGTPPSVGVVAEGYEYQRYQQGGQPYWVPLRFPGQYHDAETDLFENWNRYYDPDIGQYLQAEPMASMGARAASWPVYGYAESNPVRRSDTTGLYVLDGTPEDVCPNWSQALQRARQAAGCDVGAQKCGCPGKVPQKICEILADGMGPPAFIVDIPATSLTRHGGVPFPTAPPRLGGDNYGVVMAVGPRGGEGEFGIGPIMVWAEFRYGLCYSGSEEHKELLAKSLLHESFHAYKQYMGPDPRTNPEYPTWMKDPGFMRGMFMGVSGYAAGLTDECFGG